MKAQLEAVVFDVDGVIIDTEKLQSDCFELMIRDLGYDLPPITQYGTVQVPGESTEETWERIKCTLPIGISTDALSAEKRQAVLMALDGRLEAMPGVEALLDDIKGNALIGAASSAKPERVAKIFQSLGILELFDVIITSTDVASLKPAPDPYLAAANRLGVAAGSCVAIEDTEMGVVSARSAGMKVLAVPTVYTQSMNFQKASSIMPSLAGVTLADLAQLFT